MSSARKKNAPGIYWKFAAVATAIAVAVLILPVIRYFTAAKPRSLKAEFPALGTIAKVSVYSSEKDLDLAYKLAYQEFQAVNELCSLYNPASELSRLNETAASAPFACSPEMWELLTRSKKAWEETGGYFDITVKPLMDLWGFYQNHRDMPPSDAEIKKTLKMVGFDKVILNEQQRTVLLTVPGMALDMGGIAKGYAADRAAEAIKAAGISSGVIDIGGNLRMLAAPPPGRKFYRVAIRDPHDRKNVLDKPLSVPPGHAVSSSGDYERFVTINGQRYGHIISPKTGRPATVCAVSVISANAMDADIFSTACAIGGEEAAGKIQKISPETLVYFTR